MSVIGFTNKNCTDPTLNNNKKVKTKLIETVAKYHEVFTTDLTKVGKTDKLSMKIVSKDNAVAT